MDSETPTAEITSIGEEPSPEEEKVAKEYVLCKTLRLIFNLLTHILMLITVFVCLVYACKRPVGFFELHIILCVVGYQFFMCQGVLALAKYNVWSVYLRRLHRIHIHWVLEFIAAALVTAGSVLYILKLPLHFTTLHGGFETMESRHCINSPMLLDATFGKMLISLADFVSKSKATAGRIVRG